MELHAAQSREHSTRGDPRGGVAGHAWLRQGDGLPGDGLPRGRLRYGPTTKREACSGRTAPLAGSRSQLMANFRGTRTLLTGR